MIGKFIFGSIPEKGLIELDMTSEEIYNRILLDIRKNIDLVDKFKRISKMNFISKAFFVRLEELEATLPFIDEEKELVAINNELSVIEQDLNHMIDLVQRNIN